MNLKNKISLRYKIIKIQDDIVFGGYGLNEFETKIA